MESDPKPAGQGSSPKEPADAPREADGAPAAGPSCAHCGAPLERRLPVCPACQLTVHEACTGGHCPVVPWRDYPAPPPPTWLGWLTVLLLLPATGGGCILAAALADPLARALELPEALVGTMLVGGTTGLPLVGLIATLHRFLQYRTVRRDEDGFALGVTAKWRGTRLAWDRIAGFRQVTQGVMLRVRRQPWTRLFGPVIRCEGREVHDLIEQLEQHGVYRG